MNIENLYNHPEHVSLVSGWIYDEFVKGKSSWSLEKINLYFGKTNLRSFPITLIAISDDWCIGTVSISENDLKSQNVLKPWLASLYVSPNYRGKGVAEQLVNQVKVIVKELGYEMLYLRTEHTSEYYRRLGWEFLYKTLDEKGQQTEVLRYLL